MVVRYPRREKEERGRLKAMYVSDTSLIVGLWSGDLIWRDENGGRWCIVISNLEKKIIQIAQKARTRRVDLEKPIRLPRLFNREAEPGLVRTVTVCTGSRIPEARVHDRQ